MFSLKPVCFRVSRARRCMAGCFANTEGYRGYTGVNVSVSSSGLFGLYLFNRFAALLLWCLYQRLTKHFASWQKLVSEVRLAVGILTLSTSRHWLVSLNSPGCCCDSDTFCTSSSFFFFSDFHVPSEYLTNIHIRDKVILSCRKVP